LCFPLLPEVFIVFVEVNKRVPLRFWAAGTERNTRDGGEGEFARVVGVSNVSHIGTAIAHPLEGFCSRKETLLEEELDLYATIGCFGHLLGPLLGRNCLSCAGWLVGRQTKLICFFTRFIGCS